MSSNYPQNLSSGDYSSFNLSFLLNTGASRWFSCGEKLNTSSLNPEFKAKIPKNKIFEISSKFFNITKHKQEVLSKYECFYDEGSNTLTLILTEKNSFSEFSKEIMMNLFSFTQKVGIDTICFLLSKKNPQYPRILQDLMIVGFKPNPNKKEIPVGADVYKVMEIATNSDEEIEEFYFE